MSATALAPALYKDTRRSSPRLRAVRFFSFLRSASSLQTEWGRLALKTLLASRQAF